MSVTDGYIRLGVFLGAFVLFAGLEALAPKRKRNLSRAARWPGAWLLVVLGGAAGRLVLPIGLAGAAMWAQGVGLGILPLTGLPGWAQFIVALLVLDFAVWAQHAASHLFYPLWRLHRVHHADPDVDVTTSFRFHPVEIGLSALWKALVVILLGAPAAAAFWFEVVLNACAQFNHANMALPRWLDAPLRLLIVTPDMHRVHHSIDRRESDSNYGFCLSIWDRIFGVYTPRFSAGETAPIGQETWREAGDQRIDRLLLQPLRKG